MKNSPTPKVNTCLECSKPVDDNPFYCSDHKVGGPLDSGYTMRVVKSAHALADLFSEVRK